MMARKRTSKRRRNFVALPFSSRVTVGGIADDVAAVVAGPTFGEDLFCISIDTLVSLKDAVAGEGPLQIAVAHGDLTAAEAVEALDADLTDPDDIIQRERARRPVRSIGKFIASGTDEILAHGTKIRTPLRFSVGDGHALEFLAVNRSGATLAAGPRFVDLDCVLFGRWQR